MLTGGHCLSEDKIDATGVMYYVTLCGGCFLWKPPTKLELDCCIAVYRMICTDVRMEAHVPTGPTGFARTCSLETPIIRCCTALEFEDQCCGSEGESI